MRSLSSLAPLTLLLACQEASIGTRNAVPTVSITSHFEGDQVLEGVPFTARATAGDADGAPEDLVAKWYAGGDLACQNTPPDDEGISECEITLWTDSDPPRIQIEVRDTRNASASHAVDLEVLPVSTGGDAPSAQIVEPVDGEVSGLGEPLTFRGLVSDLQDESTALELSWSSSIDGVFNTLGADSSGTALFVEAGLSAGSHVITLTVTDTDGNFSTAVITQTINGLPSAPVVSITPDPPQSSEDLLATIETESVDPEGSPVTYRYTWIRDGVTTADMSALITASDTTRAENWTVRVTPNDGLSDGPFGEASVIIENTPPTVQSVTLSPDPAFTDDLITATPVVDDADGDGVNITYAWTVNGLPAGGMGNTLSGVTDFDRDDLVQVLATPNDGSEDGPTVGSNVLTIANSPPTAPTVSVAPTQPVEQADDLLCTLDSLATDPDQDPLTYSFSWDVNGLSYPQVDHVGPFTTTHLDDSVDLLDTWDGEAWTCEVIASDAEDDGPAGSDTVTVGQYTFLPDYDGAFDISPTVVFACAGGAVNINLSTMVFADVGGDLLVTGAPTTMRQSPGPVDENFSASGVIPGACEETYVVSGSFADNDSFSGLFEIQFNGWGCLGCTDQSYPISGTRQ